MVCELKDIPQGQGGKWHQVNCTEHGRLALNVAPNDIDTVFNKHTEMIEKIASLMPKPGNS